MRDAFQVVNHHMQQAGDANKRRYDARVRSVRIADGDHVLIRNTEKGGTGKLRSWWEDKIYVVEESYDHVPVFVISPLGGGKSKTVHRNMLMICLLSCLHNHLRRTPAASRSSGSAGVSSPVSSARSPLSAPPSARLSPDGAVDLPQSASSPDLSDTTLVSGHSPAVPLSGLPVVPVPFVEGEGDVSVSSPDVTFLGFPTSSDEEQRASPPQPVQEPTVSPSSESSEYQSAAENLAAGPSALGRDVSDQSAASYRSAVSDQSDSSEPRSDASSGEQYSPSRYSSDLSSGSPTERPRFPSRLQRYPQRVRRAKTILTYESLGEPHVCEYKVPKLPRHLR